MEERRANNCQQVLFDSKLEDEAEVQTEAVNRKNMKDELLLQVPNSSELEYICTIEAKKAKGDE